MIDTAKLRALPTARDLQERHTFASVAEVPLFDWAELDEATFWCASQWRANGKHYRRLIDAQAEKAQFQFSDTTHAVEFKLRFG